MIRNSRGSYILESETVIEEIITISSNKITDNFSSGIKITIISPDQILF